MTQSSLLTPESPDTVQWSSRLGHILAAAGSAVGIGAIWKFPYVTATNGGGAFLLLFLFFSLTLGLAVFLAETFLGSSSREGVVRAFRNQFGRHMAWAGVLGIFCAWCIYGFYSVVGGWTVGYTLMALSGQLDTEDTQSLQLLFNHYVSHPYWPVVTHLLFATMTCCIVLGGVQKGVEKAVKVMMPLLLLIMLALIVMSMQFPGAGSGLRLFLFPDIHQLSGKSVLDALGLAFFSLSVGLGIHTTYGAYLPDSRGVARSGLSVVFLSCTICVLAGMMIFPALAVANLTPSAGPGLTFMTMPVFFSLIPFGNLWATAFFTLLLVAALSSSISLLEHIVAFLHSSGRVSRRQACLLATLSIMLLGTPVALSFGPLSDVLIAGKSLFDLLDFATSNIMMPVFAIILCLLFGWSPRIKVFLNETLPPLGRRLLLFIWRYAGPVSISVILFRGIL